MKKRILALFGAIALMLSGCGGQPSAPETDDSTLHVLATTFPVYLLTTSITQSMADVEVSLLVNAETSCLHDYTLTVADMKAIETADIIVMNGAGMENFMSDALAHSDAVVIDCSRDVELLPMHGHSHDHDDDDGLEASQEADPHIWLDPDNAEDMLETIAAGLAPYTPYTNDMLEGPLAQLEAAEDAMEDKLDALPNDHRQLITFHDGFHYFADAFDLELLMSIEEEEGSEASAAEIKEIVSLINDNHIPAIFTEKKGSTATAEAIARETGCGVAQLDMMMSGEGTGIEIYIAMLEANVDTVLEALQ